MTTVASRTFRSGNSAASRLPKEVAYEGDVEATIVRLGDVLTIYPTQPTVAAMLAQLAERPRPTQVERRNVEPIPERAGL